VILLWILANLSYIPNLKFLALAFAKILKETPKFLRASQAQDHAHFSSAWDFILGLGKPQRRAKFEVAGFIYYANITKLVFKNLDKPKWGNSLLWG